MLAGTSLNNQFTVCTEADFNRSLQNVLDDFVAFGTLMSECLGTRGGRPVNSKAVVKVSTETRSRWALERAAWEKASAPQLIQKTELRSWKSKIAKDTVQVRLRRRLGQCTLVLDKSLCTMLWRCDA
jgi:hypothetical protein